ncbi:MAG: hypothetical protein H6709_14715 [Kofleriaceae bacterium]|nr:hypothetical protein [Kofleriaceae bacterium]
MHLPPRRSRLSSYVAVALAAAIVVAGAATGRAIAAGGRDDVGAITVADTTAAPPAEPGTRAAHACRTLAAALVPLVSVATAPVALAAPARRAVATTVATRPLPRRDRAPAVRGARAPPAT